MPVSATQRAVVDRFFKAMQAGRDGEESLMALFTDDAVLTETDEGIRGTVQFALPRSVSASDRDVAIRSASDPSGPFQISAVEAAIADIAVAVMQLTVE